MIIDTHLHVWNTAEVKISWLADAGLPPRAPVPEDRVPVENGARRYILIEADADETSAETDWLTAIAHRDQRVHGIVAGVTLEGPSATEEIERIATLPEVVGVRRLLQDRDLFASPALLQGLKALAHHDLPFDACVRSWELPSLRALLEQVPELTIVLDHMGKPPVGETSAMDQWKHNMTGLSDLPNVHCKLSGLPAECRDTRELDSAVAEVVRAAFDAFGAERCIVGSDQPVSIDPLDWCSRALGLLPEGVREAVARKNALNIYPRRRSAL